MKNKGFKKNLISAITILGFVLMPFLSVKAVVTPTIMTYPATYTSTTATLNGFYSYTGVDPINVRFNYGTTPLMGTFTAYQSFTASSNTFSANLTGLTSNTTYYFRAEGITNGQMPGFGTTLNFTTSVTSLPTVMTYPATSITQTGATLNGYFVSNGNSTQTYFEYANNQSMIGATSTSLVSQSGNSGNFSENISGLTAGATYYFRAVAKNAGGTKYGTPILSFVALSNVSAITVTTNNASSIGYTYADLNGYVDTNGQTVTKRYFYWGTNGNVNNQQIISGNVTSPSSFSYSLTGLTANTTYSFKACAETSNQNQICGNILTFTTTTSGNNSFSVTTNSATGVGISYALLNGYVNPGNFTVTQRVFNWGINGNMNNIAYVYGTITSPSSYSFNLGNLSPNTTYTYNACATTSGGSMLCGATYTFTTLGGWNGNYACSDGYDNDYDGYTDMNDSGCSSFYDNDESNGGYNNYACNDGIDNDYDGYVDFPNDIGCTSSYDTSESNSWYDQYYYNPNPPYDYGDDDNNFFYKLIYGDENIARKDMSNIYRSRYYTDNNNATVKKDIFENIDKNALYIFLGIISLALLIYIFKPKQKPIPPVKESYKSSESIVTRTNIVDENADSGNPPFNLPR